MKPNPLPMRLPDSHGLNLDQRADSAEATGSNRDEFDHRYDDEDGFERPHLLRFLRPGHHRVDTPTGINPKFAAAEDDDLDEIVLHFGER